VKPFNAFAVTATDLAELPAVRLRLAGETVREKSGVEEAAATVNARVAVWVRVPEMPVKEMVGVPAAALAAAVMVML
jgi:hypothetical protein